MSLILMMKTKLGAFVRSERGSVPEALVILPIMFWAYMASYVFFDGYRQSSVNLKAAYTISDMISRETDPINNAYIDSMHQMHRLLTSAFRNTTLRVTVVRWDEEDNRYYRNWSAARGGALPRTDADMIDLASRLPVMTDNELVILVETTNLFQPVFPGVGMGDVSLDNFVFTRPRFADQLLWES